MFEDAAARLVDLATLVNKPTLLLQVLLCCATRIYIAFSVVDSIDC